MNNEKHKIKQGKAWEKSWQRFDKYTNY